ncbi:hypothetical protein [Sulfitobacter sp. JB4-11]|uniref:hypothetical protein n=1 Tax=Sulfitobacter rhodophyticola TaxID=3238304 RepID=UPI003513704F
MHHQALSPLEQGARNLLLNCANCQPGQTVLFVHETENDGYYDPELLNVLREAAVKLGLVTHQHAVPIARDVSDPDAVLSAKMHASDCTVFLARLGDQIRFRTKDAALNQIISYALDRDMLASPFGTLDYAAFDDLKHLINDAFAGAEDIHVTCPAGTDFRGGKVYFQSHGADVTRKRFPVSVFTPVPANRFSGRVAQRGFLTGTGSNYYSPWSCGLSDTLFVNFDGTHITRFDGNADDIAAATAHYESVAARYGLDPYFVHSWHAGIHPGCAFKGFAGNHMERWSGSAFGNPRLLHFHTCGDYPPGEISLNVLDPTVRLDGVAVWENGILHPDRIADGAALLSAHPEMAAAFRNPATEVGQAPGGELRLYA